MSTPNNPAFDENEWQAGAAGAPRFEFEEVDGDASAKGFDARDYEVGDDGASGGGPRQAHRAEFAGYAHSRPFPDPPEYDRARDHAWAGTQHKDSRMWASLGHLAGAIGVLATGGTIGWLAPLLIWLTRKDYDDFAAEQAKEALNFQITTIILSFIAGILCMILIGIPILLALIVGDIVFSIVGAIKTHRGEPYSYPYNFRLIR